ncbi:unnamed protein product [Brassica napus]|uniref:(rape) hypothetical protein n=1 Tax=Brassica napus TaxID=3708 RepID=A0A816UMZ4_BRANA|nr:unnamed protein product [Brassica napus]
MVQAHLSAALLKWSHYSLLFFPISIMFSSPMSTTPVKIYLYPNV